MVVKIDEKKYIQKEKFEKIENQLKEQLNEIKKNTRESKMN